MYVRQRALKSRLELQPATRTRHRASLKDGGGDSRLPTLRMAGLYGQLAAVAPGEDLVAVITAHLPATTDASTVTRWLLEKYILPAGR
jgi:hypothetical protein